MATVESWINELSLALYCIDIDLIFSPQDTEMKHLKSLIAEKDSWIYLQSNFKHYLNI